jgi:ribosomal protein L20A (L18A)
MQLSHFKLSINQLSITKIWDVEAEDAAQKMVRQVAAKAMAIAVPAVATG